MPLFDLDRQVWVIALCRMRSAPRGTASSCPLGINLEQTNLSPLDPGLDMADELAETRTRESVVPSPAQHEPFPFRNSL